MTKGARPAFAGAAEALRARRAAAKALEPSTLAAATAGRTTTESSPSSRSSGTSTAAPSTGAVPAAAAAGEGGGRGDTAGRSAMLCLRGEALVWATRASCAWSLAICACAACRAGGCDAAPGVGAA
eukprot:15484963-Alexandrium_andersonii.AAC.1